MARLNGKKYFPRQNGQNKKESLYVLKDTWRTIAELRVPKETPRALIETTRKTQKLDVQYVTAIKGTTNYNAFVCELPLIEPGQPRYKLFVKENPPCS